MNISEEEIRARRSISNGRLLIFVTAIPLIASLLKLYYLGLPTIDNVAHLINPDTFTTVLLYFPTLGHSDIMASDNIVSISLFIGLIIGVTTLMRGTKELKNLE